MKSLSSFIPVCFLAVSIISGCSRPSPYTFVKVESENRSLNLNRYPTEEPVFFEIAAQPSLGFQFEYYLYIPASVRNSEVMTRLLIEPNNTGDVSDTHSRHVQQARQLITASYVRSISERLHTPLLVPVFDRPETGWERYTHALDRDTLEISQGKLRRIDLQLIAMIEHSKTLLEDAGVMVRDRVFLNGFSASGNFVNRFVALHPEIVRAAVSGGVNGTPIIPSASINGQDLPYHVGIADVEVVTGEAFDIESYRNVAQYIYMGELDDNDTLPYDDAYNEHERRITEDVLGKSMAERWKNSQAIYRAMDLPVRFVTYRGTGHQITEPIIRDVVRFFESHMGTNLESPSSLDHVVPDMP